MEVIPLTLALSLLLSLTFIVLFVREFSRPDRAGAEHDSLLPLESELPVAVRGDEPVVHPDPAEKEACAKARPGSPCCAACQRRKDRAAAAAAARPLAST